MPNLAANLSLLFTELPFLDRFAAAASAGFKAVEFLWAYDVPAAEVAARLQDNRLVPALFNLPPGDFAAGERGFGAIPGRERDFAAGLDQALAYAAAIGGRQLHALAGKAEGSAAEAVFIANLKRAADIAAEQGVTILIEPLNLRDNPGYFLNRTTQAASIIERVGRDNLRLQLDLYHCQISEGDVATHIRALAPITAHVQIAGVPGRNEPDRGEVNYPFLLDLLDEIGYGGWIGCEYRPFAGTREGLGWAKRWGIGGKA